MIETLTDHLQSYSHPFIHAELPYHSALVRTRTRLVVDAALADGYVQLCSNGLDQLLDRWADHGDVWVPELGLLEESLVSSNKNSLVYAAVCIGLRAFCCGFQGYWSAKFNQPRNLDLGVGSGGFVIHDAIDVSIEESGAVVNTTYGAHSIRAPRASDSFPVECVGSAAAAARGYPPPDSFGKFGKLQSGISFAMVLADTLDLLLQHSPKYLDWVKKGCRCVLPIESDEFVMESGSSRANPGLVHISAISYLPAVAEMLVHESSHQHYYMATLLGPIDDGSDKNLYYSPVKQKERPISNILLAYHAFANVALLMSEMLNSGVNDTGGWMDQNCRLVLGQAAHLDEALRTTRSLTDVGSALYKPLALKLSKIQA